VKFSRGAIPRDIFAAATASRAMQKTRVEREKLETKKAPNTSNIAV
jgi:hypothetical protein